jgi:hypothetical protein
MTTNTDAAKKGIFSMKNKCAGESSDVAKSPGNVWQQEEQQECGYAFYSCLQ